MKNQIDANSVLIYLCMFCLSLLFIFISSQYMYRKDGTISRGRNRIIAYLFIGVGIIIPCIFAAFRGLNVGTDIGTYIIHNFNYASNSDLTFLQFRDYVHLQIPEPLFVLLLYICCKVGNVQLLFFVIEVFVIVPLAYSIVKVGSRKSMTIGFVLFYFLFYNFSLSGMRQSIAMSFLTVALTFLMEKKYRSTIFFIIIAQLFHMSVVLIVLITATCYFVNRSRYKKILCSIIALCLLIAFFGFASYAYKVASLVAIFNPRYGYFIETYFHSGINFSEIPSTDIVVKTALVSIPLWQANKKGTLTEDNQLMTMCILLGRYFVLFNGVFYESMRIAYYFDWLIVMYVPKTLHLIKHSANRMVYKSTYVSLAFLYWIYFIMYIGGYGTNLVTFNI